MDSRKQELVTIIGGVMSPVLLNCFAGSFLRVVARLCVNADANVVNDALECLDTAITGTNPAKQKGEQNTSQ
eukprot:3673648-Amphidinium_carterae.1